MRRGSGAWELDLRNAYITTGAGSRYWGACPCDGQAVTTNPQPPLYLDMRDDLLASGLKWVDAGEIVPLIATVMGCQRGDGGFAAGATASNPADTDLAVASLSMLSEQHLLDARLKPLLGVGADCQGCRRRCMWTVPAAAYVNRLSAPVDLHGCFHRLNLRRMLAKAGVQVPLDAAVMADLICTCWQPAPADVRDTFIAAQCFQMMALDMPLAREALHLVAARQGGDDGFDGSISATAAAVAFLAMNQHLDEAIVPGIGQFLRRQLATSDNLPDIFHALLTLWTLRATDAVDLPVLLQRLRALMLPAIADIESAYYCLATTALLKLVTVG